MNNIIEKFGIKPVPIYTENSHHGSHLQYCLPNDVDNLEQQRNEMLEALIFHLKVFENIIYRKLQNWETNVFYKLNESFIKQREAIEKATGKSWEEIKNL